MLFHYHVRLIDILKAFLFLSISGELQAILCSFNMPRCARYKSISSYRRLFEKKYFMDLENEILSRNFSFYTLSSSSICKNSWKRFLLFNFCFNHEISYTCQFNCTLVRFSSNFSSLVYVFKYCFCRLTN